MQKNKITINILATYVLIGCNANQEYAESSFNITENFESDTIYETGVMTVTGPDENDTSSGSQSGSGSGSESSSSFPVCGNNILEDGEECDFGEFNSDIANCTTHCKYAICGDGLVQKDIEHCDDGEKNGSYPKDHRTIPYCNFDCSNFGSYCGDGKIDSKYEMCDPGIPGSTCKVECRQEIRYVFISALAISGDLLKLKTEEICNFLAENSENKKWENKKFKPWISSQIFSPKSHFDTNYVSVYMNILNDLERPVAVGWKHLTGGKLQYSIIGTENEDSVEEGSKVWSNTKIDGGKLTTNDCNGWTNDSSSYHGQIGDPFSKDSNWTNEINIHVPCDLHNYHIYCFEDY